MAHGTMSSVLRYIRRVAGGRAPLDLSDGHLLERFFAERDEGAFTALLLRHGPMVFGVCRRVLGNQADAEDAFQATFLVLVRRAGSIHKHESVGSWLHGVAHRLAQRARVEAARRRGRERQTPGPAEPVPFASVLWADVRAVLDEELERMPEKYRAPLVLCYLEGKSYAEAARQLGWADGTVCGRLARARDMLRSRLVRRGVTLSAALAAEALADPELLAMVPLALAETTVRLAALLVSPEAVAAAGLSASVNLLVEGMMKTMFLSKMKSAVAILLTFGILATGAGVVAHQSLAQKAPEAKAGAESKQPAKGTEPPKVDDKSAGVDPQGDPLPYEAISRLGTTRLKHGGYIGFLRFTSNGKLLISQAYQETNVWDAAAGRLLLRFPKEAESGDWGGSSLSSDGKMLATPGENTIRLWDVETAKEVRTIGTGRYVRVCFSTDGKMLASQGGNTFVNLDLWDVESGKNVRSWQVANGMDFVCPPLFTKDDKTLITGNKDNALRFWDVATGMERKKIDLGPTRPWKIILSPDGALLALTGMNDKSERESRIRLIDVAEGKEVIQLTVPEKQDDFGRAQGFSEMAFTPDGQRLVAAGIDESLIFFDPATGKEQRRLAKGFTNLFALAVAPDGKTIASAVGGKTIRLTDAASGRDLFQAYGHSQGVYGATFALNGKMAATIGGENSILLWDTATGRELRRLVGHTASVTSLELSADGSLLVSKSADKTIRIWNPATGKEVRKIDNPAAPFGGSVSPNGKSMVVIDSKPGGVSVLRLLDVETGKERGSLKSIHPWFSAVFTPDGQTLLAWTGAQTVHLLDPATAEERKQYPIDAGGAAEAQGKVYSSYTLVLSPDGKLLAYGNQQKQLMVMETMTGKVLQQLNDLPDGVSAIAFSPDAKSLAWGGWRDPTVHLTELSTGKERHRFEGQSGRVLTLAFSADGRSLISGNEDTTAMVWDLTGRLRERETWGKPLTPEQLDAAWTTLSGDAAPKAYRTLQQLAGTPKDAATFLKTRLQPVPIVDEKRVAKLIADLDSDDFNTRENATKELEKFEEGAVAHYRKALDGKPSLETRRRLEALVEKHAEPWRNPSPERRRTIRAVEALELAGTPEARQVLEGLAKGASGARLTEEAKGALERHGKRKS